MITCALVIAMLAAAIRESGRHTVTERPPTEAMHQHLVPERDVNTHGRLNGRPVISR
jgi:hypothetical protein